MNKESKNKLLIITFFAIAMGYLEATVVIYLRKLFYTGGFAFPLKGFVDPAILGIEWVREFATIIMLITIGMLAGKKFYERFAYFIYTFAIWDIFYYITLKIILDWPSSLLTWDILFLIPFPWVGPVISPIIYALLFIGTSLIIINNLDKKISEKINVLEWTLMILGVILTLITWMYDYGKILIEGNYLGDFFSLNNNTELMQILSNYSPQYYNWIVFLSGAFISFVGVFVFYVRTNKQNLYKKLKQNILK